MYLVPSCSWAHWIRCFHLFSDFPFFSRFLCGVRNFFSPLRFSYSHSSEHKTLFEAYVWGGETAINWIPTIISLWILFLLIPPPSPYTPACSTASLGLRTPMDEFFLSIVVSSLLSASSSMSHQTTQFQSLFRCLVCCIDESKHFLPFFSSHRHQHRRPCSWSLFVGFAVEGIFHHVSNFHNFPLTLLFSCMIKRYLLHG